MRLLRGGPAGERGGQHERGGQWDNGEPRPDGHTKNMIFGAGDVILREDGTRAPALVAQGG